VLAQITDISCRKVHSLPIEGVDGMISLTPSGTWNKSSSTRYVNHFQGKVTFNNWPCSYTSSSEAQASLQFTGDAVAIYGSVSPNNANLQVEIDGQVSNSTVATSSAVSSTHAQVRIDIFT
jgi:hypothetical protein